MRARSAGAALVALALAACVVVGERDALPYQFGVDFYQIWGVPVAHRIVGASPYVDAPGYAQALNTIADASAEPSLKRANRLYRDTLVPMATPLFNAAFAFLPQDYGEAHLLHLWTLFVATALAVVMLGRLRGLSFWTSACAAMLVEITFNPFVQDVRVGNVNSLQLLFIAAMLWLATAPPASRPTARDGSYLPCLLLFAAFKPNTVWIAAALAVQYGLVRGPKRFIMGSVVAAAVGLATFSWTGWFFGDAAVWLRWFDCPQGMNLGALPASFIPGNRSLPLFLSLHSPAFSQFGYSMIAGAALVGLFALAATAMGREPARLRAVARDCLSDPWFAASSGVVLTYATSPMVWPHYHMFALVPIFWLARGSRAGLVGTWSAVACYATLSTPLIALLVSAGRFEILDTLTLVSWMPLVAGLAAHVAAVRRAQAP